MPRFHSFHRFVFLFAFVLPFTFSTTVPSLCAEEATDAEAAPFRSIFNGKDLAGWEGDAKFWSVKDGAITGTITAENKPDHTTYLIWRQGELDDFELRLKFRIEGEGANSGVQYRAREVGEHRVAGYQADIDSANDWTGAFYEQDGRGMMQTPNASDKEKIAEALKPVAAGEWSEYAIRCHGHRITHTLNGVTLIDQDDNVADKSADRGILAFQLHAGHPMIVQFKDVELKRLPLANNRKKVVFVAGKPSHGWGAHEHNAGSRLLARILNGNAPQVVAVLYRNGWPEDPTAFDNANCLVMYSDGGGGHMVMPHLKQVDELRKKGMGVVCIHYAVEIPKGEPGKYFLDWLGGYFETDWSVNPHWTAEFKTLPDHPITRGVKPFSINDEWYYHMRFRENESEVTPILTAIPPESTLSRPDGPHSGNPHVRAKKGEPQHVAWAYERPDGGRGFGFTGGHFHWNWRNDDFRRLVLNAIVWAAKAEVPEAGVPAEHLSWEELEAYQDYPKPENWKRPEE